MPVFSLLYRRTTKLNVVLAINLLAIVLLFPFNLNAQQSFNWAGAFGGNSAGNSETVGRAVVADSAGNVYSTGYFTGTVDFDPGPGTFNKTSVAAEDIYISKLDGNGNFLWVKTIGSNSYNEGHSIDVDLNGNVYVTGNYAGTADFDPGGGVFNLVSNGGNEFYILKLDTHGNFVWAKSFGGPSFDNAYGIKLDVMGNVYATGYFDGTVDFDPGIGVYNLTGAVDIFVLKLDVNGDFVWAKSMAGGDIDYGVSLDVDTAGNVYTIGSFNLTVDFDPGANVYNLTSNGDYDFFILKLDKNGNFVWAQSDGATNFDTGRSVCVDNKGYVFLTGGFRGYLGSYNLSSGSGNNGAFISKLDTAGNLKWAKKLSGSAMTGIGDAYAYSITLDTLGNSYTSGSYTYIVDFDPSAVSYTLSPVGLQDVFISKLDANGNFICATSVGSTGNDISSSICADKKGNIYTTGSFTGTLDFDASPSGVFNVTPEGLKDAFVYKVSQSCLTTVGVKDNSFENNEIFLYPNPAKELVNIVLPHSTGLYEDNYQVMLFDASGKQILRSTIKNVTTVLNLNSFSAGFYYVVIMHNGIATYKQKLIIQ